MLRLWKAGRGIERAIPSARRGSSVSGSDGSSSPLCLGGITIPDEVLRCSPCLTVYLHLHRQIVLAEGQGQLHSHLLRASYTNFPCVRALEKQGKFTKWWTSKNELICCLGTAPWFSTNESFKTHSCLIKSFKVQGSCCECPGVIPEWHWEPSQISTAILALSFFPIRSKCTTFRKKKKKKGLL